MSVNAEKIIHALRLQGTRQRRVSELTALIKGEPYCPNESRDASAQSHLYLAFHAEKYDGYGGGADRLSTAEVREYIAECPACSQRFEWILERKAARRELGISKRVVSNYARQLAADRSEQ